MIDPIDRQAAIDLWETYHPTIAVDAMAYDKALRELPSVQSETHDKRTETHACDLISRLSEIRSQYNCFNESEEPYYRALSEVIKKLSEQADGDTISRQAAIDAVMDEFKRVPTNAIRAKNRIEALPSAHPEPEHTMEEFMYGQDLGSPEDGSL